jgi:protein TonB
MTPRRAMIISGVGLLHVAAIYALITGMATHALQRVETVIELAQVEPTTPPKPVPMPPAPKVSQPVPTTVATMPPPDIEIANTDPPPLTYTPPKETNTALPPDAAPSGIINSHTTPPYPPLARSQAHQGTVHLQMTISALGDVTAANVMESSGFPELDAAAVAWVIAHWKYKPALQAGVAMSGQTQAAIRFDLKQARN